MVMMMMMMMCNVEATESGLDGTRWPAWKGGREWGRTSCSLSPLPPLANELACSTAQWAPLTPPWGEAGSWAFECVKEPTRVPFLLHGSLCNTDTFLFKSWVAEEGFLHDALAATSGSAWPLTWLASGHVGLGLERRPTTLPGLLWFGPTGFWDLWHWRGGSLSSLPLS